MTRLGVALGIACLALAACGGSEPPSSQTKESSPLALAVAEVAAAANDDRWRVDAVGDPEGFGLISYLLWRGLPLVEVQSAALRNAREAQIEHVSARELRTRYVSVDSGDAPTPSLDYRVAIEFSPTIRCRWRAGVPWQAETDSSGVAKTQWFTVRVTINGKAPGKRVRLGDARSAYGPVAPDCRRVRPEGDLIAAGNDNSR